MSDIVSLRPLPGIPAAEVAADATLGAECGNRTPAAVPDQRALLVHRAGPGHSSRYIARLERAIVEIGSEGLLVIASAATERREIATGATRPSLDTPNGEFACRVPDSAVNRSPARSVATAV